MFDLDPGDDLELLVKTAQGFAEAQLAPRIRETEAAREVGSAAREAFEQIGLAGLEVPETCGGAGLGAVARVLVHEVLGAADPGAALALDTLGPAAGALLELGGESALRDHGLALLGQPGARAVVVTEAETSLHEAGGRLSGRVPWVPADRVDLLVVLGPGGGTLVREGLVAEPLRGSGLRAAGASCLVLDAVPVAARLGDARRAERALGRARLYVASLLLGVLQQAAAFSRAYARERVAFGRPIAHHQGLAFLIVDMQAAVDGARLLLHEAAWHADAGLSFAPLAASAFAEAVEAAAFVGPNGVQILGGHGFMQDYPVEKYLREARALGLCLGGLDAAREDAGRALLAGGPPLALAAPERA